MTRNLSQGDLAFRFTSNRLCLDFLATKGEVGHRDIERIGTPRTYSDWIGSSGVLPGQPLVVPTDVADAIVFREKLRSYFADIVKNTPVDCDVVATVNELARRPGPKLELASNGRSVLRRADRPGQAVLSSIAQDVIMLVHDQLLSRVKQCSDPTCNMFFLDNSRRNNRIWCSTEGRGCGNKAKKRAFRSRQQEPA
jgi:predicted RNA-binding Zn ribbon-like protein